MTFVLITLSYSHSDCSWTEKMQSLANNRNVLYAHKLCNIRRKYCLIIYGDTFTACIFYNMTSHGTKCRKSFTFLISPLVLRLSGSPGEIRIYIRTAKEDQSLFPLSSRVLIIIQMLSCEKKNLVKEAKDKTQNEL